MDILVIGGTRFFGYQTVLSLVEAGHDVAVFTRGRRHADLPSSVRHIIGDRENEDDLTRAAGERDWDVVWDNINRTPEHARAAIRIFRDRCDLFIYTSTLAVYTVCEGIYDPYREDDLERARPMEERRGQFPYDYGLDRRTSELLLRQAYEESDFPYVSIRLPAVIGPLDYSLRAWAYWRRILEGGPIILPDGGAEMHRPIYSLDCVQAVDRIIQLAGSIERGRAYNFAGREIVSLRDFVQASAEFLARDLELVDVPRSLLEGSGIDPDELSPLSTWGNELSSIDRARTELGFEPTPFEDWLAPSIEWHLEHRRDEDPPGWDLREEEARLVARWIKATRPFGD